MSPQQIQIDPDDAAEASVPMVQVDDKVMSDDETLAYTQGLRRKVIGTLTSGGTQLPVADKNQMAIIMQAADGLDRAALGNKRIKVEENANLTAANAAGLIAGILQKVTSQKPFEALDVESRTIREAPELPTDVPPPELVDGETATTAIQQDYDSFTAQHSPKF